MPAGHHCQGLLGRANEFVVVGLSFYWRGSSFCSLLGKSAFCQSPFSEAMRRTPLEGSDGCAESYHGILKGVVKNKVR